MFTLHYFLPGIVLAETLDKRITIIFFDISNLKGEDFRLYDNLVVRLKKEGYQCINTQGKLFDYKVELEISREVVTKGPGGWLKCEAKVNINIEDHEGSLVESFSYGRNGKGINRKKAIDNAFSRLIKEEVVNKLVKNFLSIIPKELKRRLGKLRIKTNSGIVKIYLAGTLIGISPECRDSIFSVEELLIGKRYILKFEKEGYKQKERQIEIISSRDSLIVELSRDWWQLLNKLLTSWNLIYPAGFVALILFCRRFFRRKHKKGRKITK